MIVNTFNPRCPASACWQPYSRRWLEIEVIRAKQHGQAFQLFNVGKMGCKGIPSAGSFADESAG